MHDYNGGILPSGLFWTVELPRGAFSSGREGSRATLRLRDLPLIDTFTFLGPNDGPAALDMTIEWGALGDPIELGSGSSVPPTDPAALLGRFAPARATGRFTGHQLGFSFRSESGASSDGGYAQIGIERNGLFL